MTSHYIPGIDGLRAIAVLAVVLFHLDEQYLPGGFVGVDIFFVISGYVVTASLLKQPSGSLINFCLAFYKRRIIRIFPALIVCLCVVALLKTLFIPASWLSKTTEYTGLLAFFGLSNFALVSLNDGYFAPRAEFNLFTHTWSLGVEEQFYLIFPIMLFFWLRRQQQKKAVLSLPLLILIGSFLISFALAIYESSNAAERAFYLLPSRFWELASGGLLCLFHHYTLDKTQQARVPLCKEVLLLSSLCLMALAFMMVDDQHFPYPWAVLPVVASLIAIHAVRLDSQSYSQLTLENRPIRYVGKISYSLYLWHWPVFVLFKWTCGLQSPAEMIIASAIALSLAVLSYHLVEQPIRKNQSLRQLPAKRIIAVSVLSVVMIALAVRLVFSQQAALTLSQTANTHDWYPYTKHIHDEVAPDAPQSWAGRTLYVLGDSHAGAYGLMFEKLKAYHDVEVITMMQAGCSVVGLARHNSKACKQRIAQAIEQIRQQAQPGDVVFIAALRMIRMSDQWTRFPDDFINKRLNADHAVRLRDQAYKEAEDLLSQLQALPVSIILDSTKPLYKSPPFRCSDWFNRMNPVCVADLSIPRTQMKTHNAPFDQALEKLQRTYPAVRIWNVFDTLCPTESCSPYLNGRPLFFDGDHLSGYANQLLYPGFVAQLENIWSPE